MFQLLRILLSVFLIPTASLAFGIRESADFQHLNAANLNTDCTTNKVLCPLTVGITTKGGMYCTVRTIKECLDKAKNGGFDRLTEVLEGCHRGKLEMDSGDRALKCAPLLKVLKSQAKVLKRECTKAKNAADLCRPAETRVTQLVSAGAVQDEPKPMDMVKTNEEEKPSTPAANAEAPSPPPPPPKPQKPKRADKCKTDVLYIGDSHSTWCFGETLHENFKSWAPEGIEDFLSVRSVATCNSTASDWLKPKHTVSCGFRECPLKGDCSSADVGVPHTAKGLATLLKESKPCATVIQLGTSMMVAPWSETQKSVQNLIKLVHQSKTSRCIWIGPPKLHTKFVAKEKFEDFVGKLRGTVVVAGCKFIDSVEYTDIKQLRNPKSYTCAGYQNWAERVYNRELKEQLAPAF